MTVLPASQPGSAVGQSLIAAVSASLKAARNWTKRSSRRVKRGSGLGYQLGRYRKVEMEIQAVLRVISLAGFVSIRFRSRRPVGMPDSGPSPTTGVGRSSYPIASSKYGPPLGTGDSSRGDR